MVRVSFGTALVASVMLVYAAIMALLSSSNRDNDDRRSYRSPTFYISPFDIFWYMDPYYNRRRREAQLMGEEMNFLEAIFSFVFGDGDPNAEYEEDKWQKVGAMITTSGGVVTAEQLAPYLDPPADWKPAGMSDSAVVEEGFVLPVLQVGGNARTIRT